MPTKLGNFVALAFIASIVGAALGLISIPVIPLGTLPTDELIPANNAPTSTDSDTASNPLVH